MRVSQRPRGAQPIHDLTSLAHWVWVFLANYVFDREKPVSINGAGVLGLSDVSTEAYRHLVEEKVVSTVLRVRRTQGCGTRQSKKTGRPRRVISRRPKYT